MLQGQQNVHRIPLNYVSLALNLNAMPKKYFNVLNAISYYHDTTVEICFLYIISSGSLENTLYKDKGAGLKFAILNNDLANQFPAGKLKQLKFIIQCKFFLFTLLRLYLIV